MKTKELIEKLKKYPDDTEVMVLDGFNGGGYPRILNIGPYLDIITQKDEEECADCEGKVGQKYLRIGYGGY